MMWDSPTCVPDPGRASWTAAQHTACVHWLPIGPPFEKGNLLFVIIHKPLTDSIGAILDGVAYICQRSSKCAVLHEASLI